MKKKITVKFRGVQEWPGRNAINLFDVLTAAEGIALGSTVTLDFLEKAGFNVLIVAE